MKTYQLLLITFVTLCLSNALSAESLSGLKAQMIKRQPGINKLWKQDLVGENNIGLLSKRSQLTPQQLLLMNQENEDRRDVYKEIAKSTGSSVEEIGQQRAETLAKRAEKGLWLQAPSGSWYKKE